MATNSLQNVATYQMSTLGRLLSSYAFIRESNKMFNNFQNIQGQLGPTVTYNAPTRYRAASGLIVGSFQDTKQVVNSLSVDKEYHVGFEFNASEMTFNVPRFMKEFGEAACAELGAEVESDVAQNAVKNTYRTFGDGVTNIDDRVEWAKAISTFKDFGVARGQLKGFMPPTSTPNVVGADLGRFTPILNDKEVVSWDLGAFAGCNWYESNLLPIHTAGAEAEAGTSLTVTAINPAGDQITLTGATPSTTNALRENDILNFEASDLFFLTYIGHKNSQQKVQVRVTANADSDGTGQIVADIFPPLIFDGTNTNPDANLSRAITLSTDTVKGLPSHRAGLIYCSDALYLAMPTLPGVSPYDYYNKPDPASGANLRIYTGAGFGNNTYGTVVDTQWGSDLDPNYALRMALPL
jgi:hypothetical protein